DPRLLAGVARRLGSVPELLTFLSDCFERLAIMVAHLTRFFRHSPEVLRLISGRFRGDAVLFRRTADVGIVMAVIHHVTSTPAYQQCRTRDVLNRTTRNQSCSTWLT